MFNNLDTKHKMLNLPSCWLSILREIQSVTTLKYIVLINKLTLYRYVNSRRRKIISSIKNQNLKLNTLDTCIKSKYT